MSTIDKLIADGLTQVGKPYSYGDEGPSSFDCSGLIQFLFKRQGITLPRTAKEQQKAVIPVTDPRPGDLVYWGNPAYHTALYLGSGKILVAPHSGDRVKVENVYGNPTYGRVPALAGVTGTVINAVNGVPASLGLSDWPAAARKLGLEFVAVGLGVALAGIGIYQAIVGPKFHAKEQQFMELV